MACETGNPPDYEQMYRQLQQKCAAQEALIAKLQGGKAPPLCNPAYGYLTNLQYKAKDLAAQLEAFRSGKKYADMDKKHKAQLAERDAAVKKLKRELEGARRQAAGARKIWEQAAEDLEKGHSRELAKKDRRIKELEEKLAAAQAMLGAEKDRFRDKARELYQAKTELEEERGSVLKLKSQINRDYENSSKPSSSGPKRKKIANNREKSGKKPGGQLGTRGI